ncbi:MAG: pentapeptide repeat-containing protein, partial [Candidatus Electrothrix sp. ATG2]|nr:pentapeptide repeat-containing protein [Candidatus Electrothrix sp. ATG2]
GDPTFEFTRKSFGEYLTALRIIRLLRQMQKQRRRRQEDPDDGWSEKEALRHWTSFCAITAIDNDLLRFISNEFRAMTQAELLALQAMVRELLSYTINQGLPFPDEFLSKGFKEHLRLAQNAEEALLAVHFHVAELTQQVSMLKLESDRAFGEWASRLAGHLSDQNYFSFLDLSGHVLPLRFFLNNSSFKIRNLNGTELDYLFSVKSENNIVNFRGAFFFEDNSIKRCENQILDTFDGANFSRANMSGVNFKRANLGGADLRRTDLRGASLKRANLEGADLRKTNLRGANLEGAILTGTILENKDS